MSYVSQKIGKLLKRLLLDMHARDDSAGECLIRDCRYLVIENTAHDSLDGGIEGHDILLFLSEDALAQLPISDQRERCNDLRSSLGTLIPDAEREFVHEVRLEMADEDDADYQRAVPYGGRPVVSPDTVAFWEPGQIRLFISHRDAHKAGAQALARALSAYGISSFVAHDTIAPMSEWQHEILKGLSTMEIMLLYVTDDFAESEWCNQEVGHAHGRGIPVISLKLGRRVPPGFEGSRQGLRGDIDNPARSAGAVYELLAARLGEKDRLQDGLVAAFAASSDFHQARARFDRMNAHVESLSESQLETIISAYHDNGQLNQATYLNSGYVRLGRFLERATGKRFAIRGAVIWEIKTSPMHELDDLDADVPF